MIRSASIIFVMGLAAAPASAVTLMDSVPVIPPPVLDTPLAPAGALRGHAVIKDFENVLGFGALYSGVDGGPAAAAVPSVPANAAVPEPAGWALMIAGFTAMGAALRRRSIRTAASLSR